MAPLIVTEAATFESASAAGTLEMVPRNCTLEKYKKKKVPTFDVTSDLA